MSTQNERDAAWRAYEAQNSRVNPRTVGPLERAATVDPRPAPRTPTSVPLPPAQAPRHDQILARAREVPKLAKLIERHDQIIDRIAARLDDEEQQAKADRLRQMEFEQAQQAAEKHRAALALAEAKLRELGGSGKRKPQSKPMSPERLAALRANAEKARAAKRAKAGEPS